MMPRDLLNSRFGVWLGLLLGRLLPLRLGYALGNFIAELIAQDRRLPIVQAVRVNQWMVRGRELSTRELDRAVRAVFRHSVHCFVDLYHNITEPAAIDSFFPETPEIRRFIERSLGTPTGTFVAILHMSNFDMAVLSLANRGLQAQILTYSQPPGSYQAQNKLRSRPGLDVTPINNKSLYQAIQRLKTGGMVITAIDRVVDPHASTLSFFDHPAPLPTGHIRLALKAGAPIIVAVPVLQQDGTYSIIFSEALAMQRLDDPVEEVRVNARAILEIAEGLIRRFPDQWLMYYPVWPDLAPMG